MRYLILVTCFVVGFCLVLVFQGCGEGEGDDITTTNIEIACSNIVLRSEGAVNCADEKDKDNCEMCFSEAFREDISEGLSITTCLGILEDTGQCEAREVEE